MDNKKFEFDHIKQEQASSKDEQHISKVDSLNIENISMLMDIPVTISVELGRTRMKIDELLKLNTGSVVELDRLVGEPLDIFVNDKLVARGEAIVHNERLSIRLTQVLHSQTVDEVLNTSSSAA